MEKNQKQESARLFVSVSKKTDASVWLFVSLKRKLSYFFVFMSRETNHAVKVKGSEIGITWNNILELGGKYIFWTYLLNDDEVRKAKVISLLLRPPAINTQYFNRTDGVPTEDPVDLVSM